MKTEKRTEDDMAEDFYCSEITEEIWKRIEGKSYKPECTVPREHLRCIHVLHKDLDGVTHEGEMVCNAYIADMLIEIFRELYQAGYPIERMRLVDDYDADDERSMVDNNSSCFNYRRISYSDRISMHGLGLAVDINPLYNPYIKTVNGEQVIAPAVSEAYADRDKEFPYKITRDDLCCQLFLKNGFHWGGDRIDRKDYHHFAIFDQMFEEVQCGLEEDNCGHQH